MENEELRSPPPNNSWQWGCQIPFAVNASTPPGASDPPAMVEAAGEGVEVGGAEGGGVEGAGSGSRGSPLPALGRTWSSVVFSLVQDKFQWKAIGRSRHQSLVAVRSVLQVGRPKDLRKPIGSLVITL